MLKILTLAAFVPLGLAAFACSSDDDPKGKGGLTGGGNAPGTGGGIGIGGGAGTSMIEVGGGANVGSGATSGTGGGEIPPETADGLRMKACAGWTSEPELLPTVLELVVDTLNSRYRVKLTA